jgi:hypothetical protein
MKVALKIGSFLGLGLTVIPAILVFLELIEWNTHATLMAIGAVLWFATAPFWLVNDEAAQRNEAQDVVFTEPGAIDNTPNG